MGCLSRPPTACSFGSDLVHASACRRPSFSLCRCLPYLSHPFPFAARLHPLALLLTLSRYLHCLASWIMSLWRILPGGAWICCNLSLMPHKVPAGVKSPAFVKQPFDVLWNVCILAKAYQPLLFSQDNNQTNVSLFSQCQTCFFLSDSSPLHSDYL